MPAAPLAALALALAAQTPAGPPAPRVGEAELAPLLVAGPGAEGKAAYDAGRFAEAASRLALDRSPEAAYLRALALLEAHRSREAIAALEGLEGRLPDLADRILYLRGQALAEQGRKEEALAAWKAVPDGSLRAPDARLARGKLAASLGDRARTEEALSGLLGARAPADLAKPDLAASALLLAGRARAGASPPDPAGARSALLACWADHPLAPEASGCLVALQALRGPEGGPPTPEESLRRAESLLDVNRTGPALSLLKPLLATQAARPATPLACRIRLDAGRALRRERSYALTISTLRPVVERCQDPDQRVRALFLLAGAASIAGDRDEAVGLYRQLARDFPDHSLADDALFYAADLLARGGRIAEARQALAAIVRDHAGGDFRAEARFRLAWLSKQAGEVGAAVAQLLAIEEDEAGRDAYEHARAAYWRGRLLAGEGPAGQAAAAAIWAGLALRYPTDYYGLLARDRLADAGRASPGPVPPAGGPEPRYDPGPLPGDAHYRAGLLLLRMGLLHDASEELEAVPLSLARGAGDAPEPVLLLADLLDRAGDHRSAHQLIRTRARGALHDPPSAENLRAWRIAYPPAFRAEVKRWAPPAGVPADLVHALIREESALDPRIVSPAGAIGLTQLMLPTAQSVARSLKLGRPSRQDLMQASLNIRLGARYLGELVRRFEGSVALALAAYNAGGGAVTRWRDARSGLEVDEFVEEIPVEETRGYVKRVLRSYAAYRALYGGPEAAAALGVLRLGGKG
ncbi:MAG TPA: transglycosylase SLT domain-containing protein [Anaeromyxobacter sp.]|nr:transglycosylase SLT domain-containing protein [Anaeromyxobacter sp.]